MTHRAFVIQLAKEAGKRAAAAHVRFDVKSVRKKGDKSVVTQVDIDVNQFIENAIRKEFPTHSVLSEELKEVKNGSEYRWAIDPIDGTRLYVFGLPTWAVAIALLKDGEPILSALNFPEMNKLIVAEKRKGVTVNGTRVRLGRAVPFRQSVLLAGLGKGNRIWSPKTRRMREAVFGAVGTSRHFGCITVDALLIATGRADGALYYHLHDYDAYPSMLVLQEAGAVTLNEKGEPWKSGDRLMVAGHPTWVKNMLRVLRDA